MEKLYHRSVIGTITNQKASLLTIFLRRKTNHNAFTKILTNKKTQRMRQNMRNLQLPMDFRSILTYLNVVKYFEKLDVTYERACMTNPRAKYYMNMLETVVSGLLDLFPHMRTKCWNFFSFRFSDSNQLDE